MKNTEYVTENGALRTVVGLLLSCIRINLSDDMEKKSVAVHPTNSSVISQDEHEQLIT